MADPVSDPDESAQPSRAEAVLAGRILIAVGLARLLGHDVEAASILTDNHRPLPTFNFGER